jgi:hypothetical protein
MTGNGQRVLPRGRKIGNLLVAPSDDCCRLRQTTDGCEKKEPTMFAYRGSTAMITGASKGLGAAFAKPLPPTLQIESLHQEGEPV